MKSLKKAAIKTAARIHVDTVNPNLPPAQRAITVAVVERGIKAIIKNMPGKKGKKKKGKS